MLGTFHATTKKNKPFSAEQKALTQSFSLDLPLPTEVLGL